MDSSRRSRRPVVPGYVMVKKLGDGSQAQVFEMVRENGGDDNGIGAERFAVKIYHGEHAQRSLQTEFCLLRALQGHGNIVQMVEHLDVDPKLSALVLELCETDLYELNSQCSLSQSDVVRITRGVLSGLQHLHGHSVVHRDVKPENIAVVADGSARLIDFGIAVSLYDTDGMSRRKGSLEYIAPEMFNKDGYGLPVDMFAFGVTCYYVLGKQHPLAIPEITYDLAAAQSRRYSLSFGSSFSHVDKDTIDLITWLMHPCDDWRPDASFALTCPPYASSSPDERSHVGPSFESQLRSFVVAMHRRPPPQQTQGLVGIAPLRTCDDTGARCGVPESGATTAHACPPVQASEMDGPLPQKLGKLERAIYSAQLADECHATSFLSNTRRKLLDEVRHSRVLDATSRVAPASIIH